MTPEEILLRMRQRAQILREVASNMGSSDGARFRLKAAEEIGRLANEIELASGTGAVDVAALKANVRDKHIVDLTRLERAYLGLRRVAEQFRQGDPESAKKMVEQALADVENENWGKAT